VYQGPSTIEEYIKFADANSPFIDELTLVYKQLNATGFDPMTGICEFSIYLIEHRLMSDLYGGGDTFIGGVMQKLFYSIPKNNIASIYVYFTEEFLNDFFQILNNDGTREFICDILTGPSCDDVLGESSSNLSKHECVKKLSKLPLAENPGVYVDSNTQGCRTLHSVFANENPVNHCAHLSLTPTKDPNGKIKCQVSERLQVEDFFTKADIDTFTQICVHTPELGNEECSRVVKKQMTIVEDEIIDDTIVIVDGDDDDDDDDDGECETISR